MGLIISALGFIEKGLLVWLLIELIKFFHNKNKKE